MDEELAAFMARLDSKIDSLQDEVKLQGRQVDSRMSRLEGRLTELSGSVALVLHRSDDNKNKSGGWLTLTQLFTGD